MKPQRWGVVVLNWNEPAATLECVRAVNEAAAQAPALEIHGVIVDNGSENDALNAIHDAMQSARGSQAVWTLVANDRNLGFSRGMNAGIRFLHDAGTSFVLLLNSDTRLDRSALAALAAQQEKAPAPVLGLAVADGSGPDHRLLCGYRYYPWLGAAIPVYLDAANPADRPAIDYVCGSAMLCSTEFLNSIGGLPEVSFLYFEELRLMRALPEGRRPGYCPDAIVVHDGGVSARKLRHPSRHYYAAHACYRYTIELGAIRMPSVIAARLLRLAFLSLRDRSPVPLADGVRALRDCLAGVERKPD